MTDKLILHITNNDYDGAGRAALRLHQALLDKAVNSLVCVLYKRTQVDKVVAIGYGKHIKDLSTDLISLKFYRNFSNYISAIKLMWDYLLKKLVKLYWLAGVGFNLTLNRSRFDELKPFIEKADVVILHGIYEIFTPSDIARLHREFDVQIFLHPLDMEPITGGCHFNYDCDEYMSNCGNCPQLGNRGKYDISQRTLAEKKELYHSISLHWIAVNSYILDRIKSSSVYCSEHEASIIYLGVESDRYKEFKQYHAREAIGLPQDRKVILFGCFDFFDERKGASILNNVLSEYILPYVDAHEFHLLTFGGKNGFSFDVPELNWTHMGFVKSNEEMSILYRASDIYASPSIDDLGPTTVSEAFMNDLKIVAFNLGVARDLVKNGVNGTCVPCFDSEAYGKALYAQLVDSGINHGGETIQELKGKLTVSCEADEFLAKLDY